MANMLEGGGKTPILPPEELDDMGFKLVAYPMSLLAVTVQAMETALEVRSVAPHLPRTLVSNCRSGVRRRWTSTGQRGISTGHIVARIMFHACFRV